VAIGKAATQAGRPIAASMTAAEKRDDAIYRRRQAEHEQERRIGQREEREQRRARIAAEKAERRAKPFIKDVVYPLMKKAAEENAECGLPFNPRRIVYDVRQDVFKDTGKELKQTYLEQLLTKYEAEHGPLHPLLVRAPRGYFYVPHVRLEIPLGTESVAAFRRQAWTFNKIVCIEKADLMKVLQLSGWAERNDALLMSTIGFYTRAGRDLIDAIAATSEPMRPYSVHDADHAGTCIQDTLQNATLARGARSIEICDLGLQPWEGVALNLDKEDVPKILNKDGTLRRRPVGEYIKARTDRAPTGQTWEEWLQLWRYELNAFRMPELLAWLDRKMAEHGDGKLIPPGDILIDQFGEAVRPRARASVDQELDGELAKQMAAIRARQDKATAKLRAEIDRITAPLRKQVDAIVAPFRQEIATVTAEADAINREAETRRVIAAMTPDADALRAAIGKQFKREPRFLWSTALDRIAAETPVRKRARKATVEGGAP
jgi:hypothetical protein